MTISLNTVEINTILDALFMLRRERYPYGVSPGKDGSIDMLDGVKRKIASIEDGEEITYNPFNKCIQITPTEFRPYVPGEDLGEGLDVVEFRRCSHEERRAPEKGDIVIRNIDDHTELFVISKNLFNENFKAV